MAIEIIVGNVGAGKSYYATYIIWEEIKKIYNAEVTGKPYKYTHILTNIEGIKPNKYVKILKVAELIKIWEWELKQYKTWEEKYSEPPTEEIDFYNFKSPKLTADPERIVTHFINKKDNIRQFKNENDKILHHINIPTDVETAYINYVKPTFTKQGFTDCLIVIDEAHNFFKVLSAAKERLVSYHRHYDQDYILITQELKQLNRKVTGIAQKTILARNPTMKGGKSFNYKVYSGGYISFRDNNLLERVKLKADPDIFRLYSSGSIKAQKSYLKKILLRGLLPVVLVGICGYIAFKMFVNQGQHTTTHNKPRIEHTAPVAKVIPKQKKTIKVLKIKNFYFYKGKKYYWVTFQNALNKCKAINVGYVKNLDSTIELIYKIKDIKCLDTYLSSAVDLH